MSQPEEIMGASGLCRLIALLGRQQPADLVIGCLRFSALLNTLFEAACIEMSDF